MPAGGEDGRCRHVALPIRHCYRCQPDLSLQEQPLLPALDVFTVGWVEKRLAQDTAAAELPSKVTHDPAYSS